MQSRKKLKQVREAAENVPYRLAAHGALCTRSHRLGLWEFGNRLANVFLSLSASPAEVDVFQCGEDDIRGQVKIHGKLQELVIAGIPSLY